MARETIPSECFSGAWKWEKGDTVFMAFKHKINPDTLFYRFDIYATNFILQLFVLYVKTLPVFKHTSLITW